MYSFWAFVGDLAYGIDMIMYPVACIMRIYDEAVKSSRKQVKITLQIIRRHCLPFHRGPVLLCGFLDLRFCLFIAEIAR